MSKVLGGTTVKVMLYKTNFHLDSKLSLDVLDEISFQMDTAESSGQPGAHKRSQELQSLQA